MVINFKQEQIRRFRAAEEAQADPWRSACEQRVERAAKSEQVSSEIRRQNENNNRVFNLRFQVEENL